MSAPGALRRFQGVEPSARHRMFSALVAAIQTLTRAPVPSPAAPPSTARLAASGIFFPLVGAALGLAAVALHALLSNALPRSAVMMVILLFWILATGALHEDGLADAADAFGSQSSRDDILRVMKDERIGTYGAVALIFSLMLRWQALTALPWEETPFALLASQVLPRTGVVALAYWAGPASAGSGGGFAAALRGYHAAAALVLALGILTPLGAWRVIAPLSGCAAVVLISLVYFRRKLGGITGDCLGAAEQLQEIAVLFSILGFVGVRP